MAADSLSLRHSLREFVPDLGRNLCLQAAAPFSSTRSALVFAGCTAAGLSCIPADPFVHRFLQQKLPSSNGFRFTSEQITRMGGWYGFTGLGVFFTTSLICKNQKGSKVCLLAAQAALTSAVWTRLLKYACGRERPGYVADPSNSSGKWQGPVSLKKYFSGKGSYDAFPSGHSTTAFSIATVFSLAYADKAWVPPLAYGLALLTSASRLSLNRHWLSDVAVGSLIGMACARQVYRKAFRLQKKKASKERALQFHFTLYPLI